MTKEKILQTFEDINLVYNDCTRYDTLKRMLDELQEPCKDAISRQAVLNVVEKAVTKEVARWSIKELPPVNPQKPICPSAGIDCEDCPAYEPKTGHWIVDSSIDCYLDKVRCHCSECGKKKEFPADYDHIKQKLSISYKYPEVIDNFCPNCGAKMAESGEKPKSEWEHDHEILKAYSDGASAVLDKVRNEVCDIDDEMVLNPDSFYERKVYVRFCKVIEIIDKYKAEGGAIRNDTC